MNNWELGDKIAFHNQKLKSRSKYRKFMDNNGLSDWQVVLAVPVAILLGLFVLVFIMFCLAV